MRSDVPAVAPFLRSDIQARVLAETLLRDGEHTLGEIGYRSGVSLPSVQREVDRLTTAGILHSRKIGRTRVVSANTTYPLFDPLMQIIAATYGPATLVHAAFAELDGLEHVIVFGSWAARLSGRQGNFPGDVDVLLVGDVSKMTAYGIADDLTRQIGRPVKVSLMSLDRWRAGTDGFVKDIRSKPHLELT